MVKITEQSNLIGAMNKQLQLWGASEASGQTPKTHLITSLELYKVMEALQNIVQINKGDGNASQSPLFSISTDCQNLICSFSVAPSEIEELEKAFYKARDKLDSFRKTFECILLADQKVLRLLYDDKAPSRAGDGLILTGLPVPKKQGQIVKALQKAPMLKSRPKLDRKFLNLVPKGLMPKTSQLSRIYSSKSPVDCLEEKFVGGEVEEISSLGGRSFSELDSDLEQLRMEIDLSNDVIEDVKNELNSLCEAVSSLLPTAKLTGKMTEVQLMTEKLKEVSETIGFMAGFNYYLKQKNLFEKNLETVPSLQCTEIGNGCLLLSWEHISNWVQRKAQCFLVCVNDEVCHKVRNPLRKQAVLTNVDATSDITLYAELPGGKRISVGTTCNKDD